MKLTNINLVDRISVPTKRTLTDAGQMHVPCKFAKTGTQLYTAKQLCLVDEDPNKIIAVLRDEADVFDEKSIETFRSAPVTIGHPKDENGENLKLTVDNAKELQVGMLEGMPTRDEDTLGGILVLTTVEAIDALEGGTQELSAGYTCDIEEVDGKYYQRNIKANHIAIVAKGRAGSSCRISDEADLHIADELLATQTKVLELEASNEAVKVALTDSKTSNEALEIELEKSKAELTDAKEAAKEDVIVRCKVIEQARLISDMRIEDIGAKTTLEIQTLVVEDQMPDKSLEGKSEHYISAMFDIIADSTDGETPMGKLIKKQETHITVDAKEKVKDPVAAARKRMQARQSAQSK